MTKRFNTSTFSQFTTEDDYFRATVEDFDILVAAHEHALQIRYDFAAKTQLDDNPDYAALNRDLVHLGTSAIQMLYDRGLRLALIVNAVDESDLHIDLGVTVDSIGEAYDAAKAAITTRHLRFAMFIEMISGVAE